jgi:hypothetical protein
MSRRGAGRQQVSVAIDLRKGGTSLSQRIASTVM